MYDGLNASYSYITQDDGSPLKEALSLWRQAALQESASRSPPRPISPVSDEEEDEEVSPPDFPEQTPPLMTSPERKHHDRAKSEPPETGLSPSTSRKPTSSSWVRWWSLSRTVTNDPTPTGPQSGRPGIREPSSAPPEPVSTSTVLNTW